MRRLARHARHGLADREIVAARREEGDRQKGGLLDDVDGGEVFEHHVGQRGPRGDPGRRGG